MDLDHLSPQRNGSPRLDPPHVAFVGAMDYFPNVDATRFFCRDIFPLVKAAFAEVRFDIVGRNPTRLVKELARDPHVTVTGSVPDVRPFLARAAVAVAPFRLARGLQTKILEAMAMGLPVVGTSQAFQGTQATEADGIRVADEPRHFAETVLRLLADRNLHLQCSVQARQYVERHHRWDDHAARLEALLQQASEA